MYSEAPAQALRALSRFLVSERSMGDTLLEVSRITVDAVPAAEMAGITMLSEHGTPTTAVFTDPLASAAAIVLANASAYWEANQLSEQLNQAMRSRAVIEQAKGILMARSPDLGPDEAFEVLRKASQRENVKLRDIAQRIVDRTATPGVVEGG